MSAINIWGCTTPNCSSYGRPVPRDWNTCPNCYGELSFFSVPATVNPYGECSICKKANYLPHETPEDFKRYVRNGALPPFGHHCDECDDWLKLPGLILRREK